MLHLIRLEVLLYYSLTFFLFSYEFAITNIYIYILDYVLRRFVVLFLCSSQFVPFSSLDRFIDSV